MKVISTAVITTTTVRMLVMNDNGITAQEWTTIADMIPCLEELHINDNKLGDHGAGLLSQAIMNTNTLQVLAICNNSIGPIGTIAIANATAHNSSMEELYMVGNTIGQDGAEAIVNTITNNKTLKTLTVGDDNIDGESSMMIIKSLHCNNTITELFLPPSALSYSLTEEVIKINNTRDKCNKQNLKLVGFNYRIRRLQCKRSKVIMTC